MVQSKPIVSLFWNNLERAVVEKSEKGGASWIYSLDAPPFFVAGIALGSDKVEIVEYCKWIEPPVRRNEPLNARNRASYCEQESRPTIFIYRTNLLYNEVACLRA